MKCVTKRVALIAEAASAAITLAVSLDAAVYAYQQCTLIVYVWAVVKWTGACQGYDRSHRHQTLVVDDDNSTSQQVVELLSQQVNNSTSQQLDKPMVQVHFSSMTHTSNISSDRPRKGMGRHSLPAKTRKHSVSGAMLIALYIYVCIETYGKLGSA